MQTKKHNINTQLFVVTVLSAWLGLLIVGTPSQAQARSFVKEELAKRHSCDVDFSKADLTSTRKAENKKDFRLQRFVLKVRNLINDFAFTFGDTHQSKDFTLNLFAFTKQQNFELLNANCSTYQSQKVSIHNNNTVNITHLPRASLDDLLLAK